MQTANQTEVNKADELAGNAVIRVEDVHKYYELGETRVHALRGVSLEIRRGEFVAIMGASGSGKSDPEPEDRICFSRVQPAGAHYGAGKHRIADAVREDRQGREPETRR